jgi:hypothetical protein
VAAISSRGPYDSLTPTYCSIPGAAEGQAPGAEFHARFTIRNFSDPLRGKRAIGMVARARDLHIIFARVSANVAAVLLVRGNYAAAWNVFAGFHFSIGHFIFLPSFGFSVRQLGLSGFLVRTAIAGDQTRDCNRDV